MYPHDSDPGNVTLNDTSNLKRLTEKKLERIGRQVEARVIKALFVERKCTTVIVEHVPFSQASIFYSKTVNSHDLTRVLHYAFSYDTIQKISYH